MIISKQLFFLNASMVKFLDPYPVVNSLTTSTDNVINTITRINCFRLCFFVFFFLEIFLRDSLSLSRRKISRKTSGTRLTHAFFALRFISFFNPFPCQHETHYFYQPLYLGYRNCSDLSALFKPLIMYILATLLIFRSFKEFSLVTEINIAPRHQLVLSHRFR